MLNAYDLIVCEYSTKQNCFHIHTLREALQKNARGILGGYGLDYIPFAISNDLYKANDLCNQMRTRMKAEQRKRNGGCGYDDDPDEDSEF